MKGVGRIKFLADEMNGDLAKWLRIMGFDCRYLVGRDMDNKLLDICLKEGRVLLTGDKELYRRARSLGIPCVLTLENSKEEKLRKVIKTFNLAQFVGKEYRCSLCNTRLVRVRVDEVDIELPKYVKERFQYIWYCSKCRKAYWEGSHWNNILSFLRKVLGEGL